LPAGAFRAALAGRVPLTAGALLHKTRTDLRKWLLAIWLLRRKSTHATRRGEHELLLRGVVELDESLLGGRERGSGKRGRAAQRKTLVAVAAEQTPEGGPGRAPTRDRRRRRQDPDQGRRRSNRARQHVKSDGWSAYRAPPGAGYLHEPHVQATPQATGELPP